ncbi:E3 SUMO-protein ligase ZBED1-like [Drosophila willistoni]|uniref:E3 SUMO-protein ligase ZBED1-like n=1 Tax=Drosophila willistoni TaxID=7260 RepID=UPI000C26CF0F|nr:E3 SUMO-protein ligase ZBED1-like [Drosophila willistoni]
MFMAWDGLKSKMRTPIGSEACSFIMNRLKSRLLRYETRTVPRLATMLDPRFKKEGFGNPANAQQASAALENEVTSLINVDESEPPMEEQPKQSDNVLKFLSDRIQQKQRTGRSDAIITMRQYIEQQNSEQDIDPLEYWKINSQQFKHIARCASKYLCVLASSTESERTFSKAGEIIGNRRTRLKSKNVDTLQQELVAT